MPFKANADRRHHIPKQQYRATNSAAYDAVLRQRDSLTVWFTEEAIAAWKAEPRTTRGGQSRYSALAIATALTLRTVFRLALRQAEGLIGSIMTLLGLDLATPDHTTISRRAETRQLQLPRSPPRRNAEPMHLLVDSTGPKLCGAGEWLLAKHGTKTRRAWRTLHIGTDADTGHIVAATLSGNDVSDVSQVGPLLDQVDGRVAWFTADGAYDWDSVLRRDGQAPLRRCRGRAATGQRCAEQHGRVRAHVERPRRAIHQEPGPHGLAGRLGLQLARAG